VVPGTYTLLIELSAGTTITFGAAGERALDPGWYAYTGSAFGPGGLARVERHREVAAGDRDVRHWHVDSLTGHPDARLDEAYATVDVARECATARDLADAGSPVAGVGASDCDCDSHLAYAPSRRRLAAVLRSIHDRRI